MAVTIQQIAEQAGVSPGTVSRVLNGGNKENRPAIAERADRVRRIASELGYRPNVAARSMTSGRFQNVGFVNCGDRGFDWFSHLLLHGIHQRLEDRGYRLVMNELTTRQLTNAEALPTLFREHAVDAILLHIDSKIPDGLQMFQRLHPGCVVLINEQCPMDCVYPDEHMGGFVAVRHLIRAGHRSIGFYRLLPSDVPMHFSCRARLGGFTDAMMQAGLDPSAFSLCDDQFEPGRSDGAERAKEFLRAHPDLTAVVCYSLTEYTVMRAAAASLGRRIPEDIAFIVFHDEPAHALTNMPADTLIIPFKETGLRAVSMVFDLLDGPAKSLRSRRVPYRELYDASISRNTLIAKEDTPG